MAYIVPLEMPETCLDCPFRAISDYIPVENGLYKKITRCCLVPKNIKDPYHDFNWIIDNKEEWCPLKEMG